MGHVKQRKFKFDGFVKHVPVHHLLSSLAILYHVIAKLQRAYYKKKKVLVSKDSVIGLLNESIKVKLRS